MKFKKFDFNNIFENLSTKIVYVIGNARGGSTISNTLIGIHPRIYEINWNDKFFIRKYHKISNFTIFREKILRGGRYFDKRFLMKNFGQSFLKEFENFLETIFLKKNLKYLFLLPVFMHWIHNSNRPKLDDVSYFCYKTNTWEGSDLIKQNLPKTKLIIIQRNSLSVSLSMAKAFSRQTNQKINNEAIIRGALSWNRNAIEFKKILTSYPKDSHLVSYEQIILNHHKLNEIYHFLHLNKISEKFFLSQTRNIYYKKTSLKNETKTKKKGIQFEGLDRWKYELNETQIKIINIFTNFGQYLFGKKNSHERYLKKLIFIFNSSSKTVLLIKLIKDIAISLKFKSKHL